MPEDSVTVMLLPEDDTETILEKVRTTGARQVSLIVPLGNKALQTLGGFTMLRKACDITGIDVTVYSDDEKTCDMAKVCRFDVVRLESEVEVREAPPAEEKIPRIVVSTKPPEPDESLSFADIAPVETPVRSTELEERLDGLSDEDLALFDALESMSLDEDIELTPDMVERSRAAFTPPPLPLMDEEEEAVREREPRERKPSRPSPLRVILDPLASVLGNIYIAVVGLVLRVASRFQERGAKEEAPSAGVGPRERTEEQVRTLRAAKQRYYLWSLGAVVAFTILLFLFYYLSLPKVVVSLRPKEAAAQEMDISLTIVMQDDLDAQKNAVSTEGGGVTIQAKKVEVPLERQASSSASGETVIADGAATGAVVFTNLTEYDIYVPAGTRLTGGGNTFHTIEDITVPASYFWGSGSYVGKAQVGIVADTPGSAGNVDVWQITTIEGDLAGLLRVVNEVNTEGGAERPGTIVTAEDQQRLREKLISEMQEDAYAQLQQEVGDLQILSGTLEIETVNETFSHEIGGEATVLTLNATVRATALASAPGTLDKAVSEAVRQQMGEPKAGQTVDNISHGNILPVSPSGTGVNAWTYRTHVRVSLVNSIEDLKSKVRRQLGGLTYAEAYEFLNNNDQISEFSISPVFQKMPGSSRIRVQDISQLQR